MYINLHSLKKVQSRPLNRCTHATMQHLNFAKIEAIRIFKLHLTKRPKTDKPFAKLLVRPQFNIADPDSGWAIFDVHSGGNCYFIISTLFEISRRERSKWKGSESRGSNVTAGVTDLVRRLRVII